MMVGMTINHELSCTVKEGFFFQGMVGEGYLVGIEISCEPK